MPSSNSSYLKETPASYLSFQDWLKSHLGTKSSPNTANTNLSPSWELNHISSHVLSVYQQNSYPLSREWILLLTTFLSPTMSMIVHRYTLLDITLNIAEMSFWITRKMHFPVFVFFWLISGSILEGEGVRCPKRVIIKIWKWSHREREEPKIQLVRTAGKL